MFGLSRSATALWLAVTSAGLFALVLSAVVASEGLWSGAPALLFAIAGGIAESFRVPIPGSRPGHRAEMAVSSAIYVAAVLIFPLHWAIVSVAVAFAFAQAITSPHMVWFKRVFNVSQISISVAVAGLIWSNAGFPRSITNPDHISWMLLAVAGYLLTNTFLVSAIVSLASGVPIRITWWRNHRHIWPQWLGTLFVGVLIAVLWSTAGWTIALAAIPLAALFYALRTTVQLETQTIEALFELADILDARDPYTHGHSLRVGQYAEQLALAMGYSGDEAHLVFLAGRLHDIGKCAVRNEVLLKAGPLNTDEWSHMCQHPAIGASMLEHFTLFRECARFVRGHHERWDGRGYPDGLSADAIPFGARIIAVVDAYDAMVTTRPYRQALSEGEAVRRLREGAGSQWDPAAVDTWVEMIEQERAVRVSPPMAVPSASAA